MTEAFDEYILVMAISPVFTEDVILFFARGFCRFLQVLILPSQHMATNCTGRMTIRSRLGYRAYSWFLSKLLHVAVVCWNPKLSITATQI